MEKAKGVQLNGTDSLGGYRLQPPSETPTYSDLGIDKRDAHIWQTLTTIREDINPTLQLVGVILVQFDGRLNSHNQALEALQSADIPLLMPPVPRSVRVQEAAGVMQLTAADLYEKGIIEQVIPEPLGGAHRNPEVMAASLKAQLLADLADLDVLSKDDLKNRRYQRLMSYGYA